MSVSERRKTLEAEGYLVRSFVWHAPNGESLLVARGPEPDEPDDVMVNSAWDHFTKPRPSTEGLPIKEMQRCLEAAGYHFSLEGRWTLFTGEGARVNTGKDDVVMSAWLHCTGSDEPKDALVYNYQVTAKQAWEMRRMNRQQARNHTPVSVG